MKFNRIKEIEDYITEHEFVTIDHLCEIFNVSKNTIRRDIKQLTEKGSMSKVYGGVAYNNNNSMLSFFEERIEKNIPEKEKIGLIAARLVEDNDVIFVDSGTTTIQILEHLKDKSNVTIITNNLKALIILVNMPNINVIVAGGSLIRKTSSFAGVDTVAALRNYNITKCFMAATGVSIDNGLTNSTAPEFELKKVVINKSNAVCLMADSSKFEVSSLMTYCRLTDVDYIITDKRPPEKYVDFFNRNDIKLVMA